MRQSLSLIAGFTALICFFAPLVPAQGRGFSGATKFDDLPNGCELVEFSAQGDKVQLHGAFYSPKRATERAPAALLIHDAGADRSQLEEIALGLQKRDFAVLLVDLRGHGASAEGDLSWDKLDESRRKNLWAYALRDVNASAKYLRSRREVHTSNLTVVGYRSGSLLAARYAASDENARAVILIQPELCGLGYDIEGDVADLAGLPTLILEDKAKDKAALENLQRVGRDANDGNEFIELQWVKTKDGNVLDAKKIENTLARWAEGVVTPQRGGR